MSDKGSKKSKKVAAAAAVIVPKKEEEEEELEKLTNLTQFDEQALKSAFEKFLLEFQGSQEDEEDELEEVRIKDKRSWNEWKVLTEVLGLLKKGDDKAVEKAADILAKRRFLLELADKVGNWGVALAYQELFPDMLKIDPGKLGEAAQFYETLKRYKWSSKTRGTGKYSRSFGGAPSNGSSGLERAWSPAGYGKVGSCFRCGGSGHWARDCPTKKKVNGGINIAKGGQGGGGGMASPIHQ